MKNLRFLITLVLFLFISAFNAVVAQDYGCDKCSMLKEEYEAAVSPKREEIYEFFKSQCLETQTEYLTESNTVVDTAKAVKVRVTSKGKCIDYKVVKEIDKKTKKETMSFSVTKKDTIFTIGSKTPSFPGGDEALVKFISSNLKYPTAATTNKVSGTAFVQFVVTKEGTIKNIKVVRSPDESTKQEAIRLIKSMPNWIPGEYKSSQVSMVHSIPIRFVLKK